MRLAALIALAGVFLSGCATETPEPSLASSMEDADGDGYVDAVEVKYGTDPMNATSVPDVMVHKDIGYTGAVTNLAGASIPEIFCPNTMTNVAQFLWDIEGPEGNVTEVHAGELVFTATASQGLADISLRVYGPETGILGRSDGFGTTKTVSLEGHHPIGEYTIEVRACAGAGDIAIEATGVVGWVPSTEDLLAEEQEPHHGDDGHQH